ncbi:MAG: DEAD/DEAH box helicase, partial [Acidimicrobiia bacterium]
MTISTEALAGPTSFDELGVAPDLAHTLERIGITRPTPIQTLTIPDGLAGRDVCGKAQTGSGKTLAFGIPLVELATTAQPGRPSSLVLVPTRELCAQVTEELANLAASRRLRFSTVYGGVSMRRQIDRLRAGVEVLVATPGRLIDLLDRKLVALDDVVRVVIDEADQMADMGFLPQVNDIMRRIPRGHQTMLFSATLDGQVRSLVRRYMTDPVRHEATTPTELVEAQEHRFIAVHELDKVKTAAAITRTVDRTLVFVTTKRDADRVAGLLRAEGVQAASIHGDLPQRLRE